MMTRREWLASTLALIASQSQLACGSDSGGGGKNQQSPKNIYEAWQRLLDALKKSPDHLRAGADAAVATKDPKVIFEFVRDNIATVPPLSAFDTLATAVRFGVDNLLRSGVGTPRERAELLVSLLEQAGFTASVVSGNPDGLLADADAPRKVYLRHIEREFAPPPAAGSSWTDGLPASTPDPVIVDENGTASQELFDQLRTVLPAATEVTPSDLGSLALMPLVALEDGGTVYLNTLHPDAKYGESHAVGMSPAAAMAETKQVLVRLSATRARAITEPITLVEATYGWDDLAGSRVRLSPQPVLPLPAFLAQKVLAVNNFISGLTLVGSDGKTKSFVRGSAISAVGDVIEASSGGASVNGVPLVNGGDANQVASIDASAAAPRAPIVDLEVAPKDASGNVVSGLSAASFRVEEDGVQVSAVIRENGGAPRVQLSWDTSGSQPAVTDPIADGIANAIFAALPNATVQVTSVDGAPSPDGFTLTSASAVKQALLGIAGGITSPIYGGLLTAFKAAPTLLILCSDGEAETSPSLAAECLAASGACPIVAIGCHSATATTLPAALTALANASGGKFVDAGELTDTGPAAAAIAEVGSKKNARPYRLAYVTSATEGKHTVHVAVGSGEADAEYTLAPGATGGAYSEFVGMHLHIEMDDLTVERTLAGIRPVALPADEDSTDILRAASEEVRSFFLSGTWITFEGGAPTLSAWFDDLLTAQIAKQPVQDAADAGDVEGAYAAAENVPLRPLAQSLLAHAPLSQPSESVVAERALRAVVHRLLPLSRRTSVDILPTTRFVTLGATNGKQAFDECMRASLGLAIAEAALAKGSTFEQLSGAPLQALPPGTVDPSALSGFPAEKRDAMAALLNRYTGSHRIVAGDGSSPAFWSIDSITGSALGILPDGTGGAIEECQAIVDWAQTQIDELGLLVGELESGIATAWMFIAAVGKAAAVAVAEAALSFTDPLLNPSIWQLGYTIACSIESDLIANALPGGKSASHLKNIGQGWVKNYVAGSITNQIPGCHPSALCNPKGDLYS